MSNITDYALNMLKVTELASIATFDYIGSGDKLTIDKVATEIIRKQLNEINFSCEIAIGEGEKDESYGLYQGEKIGLLTCLHDYEIVVDPVDGTGQVSKNGSEGMSIIGLGKKGSFLKTSEHYMNKIAVGSKISKKYKPSLNQSLKEIVETIKDVLNKKNINVCLLNRPRHEKLIVELKSLNCNVILIQDCDVSATITVALNRDIDLYIGVGGCTEGVLTACVLKCLDGYFEAQIVDNKNYMPITNKIYNQEQLATGDVVFSCSGILNGNLLNGIHKNKNSTIVNSILIDSINKNLRVINGYY